MKRRTEVRVVSFLSAAVLVAVGFCIKSQSQNKSLALEVKNNYSRSLSDLTASVNNISLILQKTKYINDAGHLSRSAIKLLTESEISKNALSQLPHNANLEILNRFLSQVGNYALSVSENLRSNREFPKDYGDNIEILSDMAQKISDVVKDVQINYTSADYFAKNLGDKLASTIGNSLTDAFTDLEGELTDYATLVYDGPYSDHILNGNPQVNESSAVTLELAQQTAAQICDCDFSDLEFLGEQDAKIPVFSFKTANTDITVSKSGGNVVYMRKNVTAEKYTLNYNQALSKAKRFLEKNDMLSFKETYYFTDEGVCVINFAFLDGNTICYTDLVKVGVSMESGEVVLFEASGYLSNHKERAFESPKFTLEEAKLVVSERLDIKKSSVALIPTSWGEERCYEFLCEADGQEILVYINVMNLKEEEILILLKSDGGILVK